MLFHLMEVNGHNVKLQSDYKRIKVKEVHMTALAIDLCGEQTKSKSSSLKTMTSPAALTSIMLLLDPGKYGIRKGAAMKILTFSAFEFHSFILLIKERPSGSHSVFYYVSNVLAD